MLDIRGNRSKRQLSALSQDKLSPQTGIKYIIYSKIMNCQFPQKQSQRWEFSTQEVYERNAPRKKLWESEGSRIGKEKLRKNVFLVKSSLSLIPGSSGMSLPQLQIKKQGLGSSHPGYAGAVGHFSGRHITVSHFWARWFVRESWKVGGSSSSWETCPPA